MKDGIRAIFFDAGNTLLFPRIEELVQELTADGLPATVEDFHAADRRARAKLDEFLWPLLGRDEVPRTVDPIYWNEYLRALAEQLRVPEAERARLVERLSERYRQISFWSLVFPETSGFLDSLRARGYCLGVISNSLGWIEEQLGRVDLARHFSFILDSAVVGIEKPHRGIFRLALERAGVAAEEAAYVGDTYSIDIGGARRAGLAGVLIDQVGAYPDADCPRISSLPELNQALRLPGGPAFAINS